MSPKDVDALAVWDAKARTLIDRIDAVLADEPPPFAGAHAGGPLDALVRRVTDLASPPAGEIISPPVDLGDQWTPAPAGNAGRRGATNRGATNMEHQPDRIDHWDAYVCRFDSETPNGSDQPT